MLNDGDFSMQGASTASTVYFPGHVFVIEKFCTDTGDLAFHLYQSYINQYDLKGYLEKTQKLTFTYTSTEMKALLHGIHYILRNGVWDEKCVEIWKAFTKVDSSNFLGSNFQNVLSICYTSDKIQHCLQNIESYAKEKIQHIHTHPEHEIYGDRNLYSSSANILTNKEMENQLNNIILDIHHENTLQGGTRRTNKKTIKKYNQKYQPRKSQSKTNNIV